MTDIWPVNTSGLRLTVDRSMFDIDGHEAIVFPRSEQGKKLRKFAQCCAVTHREGLDVIVEHGGHSALVARSWLNMALAALARRTLERMTIHGGLRLERVSLRVITVPRARLSVACPASEPSPVRKVVGGPYRVQGPSP